MNQTEIGRRIKEQRIAKELTQEQLGNALGLNKSTIQRYETGQVDKIKLPVLQQMAKILDVNPEWIACKTDGRTDTSRPTTDSSAIRIPVLGYVRAGIPLDAIEEILDYEEIPPQMASQGEYFALKIRGSSMEPRIMEGDVVIVRKQETVDSGGIAIVLVNGNDATVKKVKITEEGITLIPSNPSFDIKFYSKKEIASLPVQIIGKVVELRGKF